MVIKLPIIFPLIFFAVFIFFFLLITPTYAQVGGTGAEVIRPVQTLWQISRNIAYLFLTIILMVIGIMIMLRQRINPQTVVGIQQALPGIIIALIIITFSYFIASLIIDLAFVLAQTFGIAILVGLGASIPAAQTNIGVILNNRNIFNLFVDALNPTLLFNAASIVGGGIADALISNIPIVGGILRFFGLSQLTGTAIALIVLIVALLNTFFRLFFALVNAFVFIILNTIFGPFLVLFSAIPGRGGNLSNWLRGLLANVLIFPVIFMLFILVAAILNRNDGVWAFRSATGIFNQPLPLMGNLPDDFIRFILAYGIILALPGVPDFIRNIIGGQTPAQLGQAVTQGTQTGQGTLGNIFARLTKGKII